MTRQPTGARHLLRTIRAAILAFVLIVAAPTGGGWPHAAAAGDVAALEAQSGGDLRATCAEGSVNGLITVSIAATLALFVEIVLPAYPILVATGLGVGCTVRVAGEHLKSYVLPLLQGPHS